MRKLNNMNQYVKWHADKTQTTALCIYNDKLDSCTIVGIMIIVSISTLCFYSIFPFFFYSIISIALFLLCFHCFISMFPHVFMVSTSCFNYLNSMFPLHVSIVSTQCFHCFNPMFPFHVSIVSTPCFHFQMFPLHVSNVSTPCFHCFNPIFPFHVSIVSTPCFHFQMFPLMFQMFLLHVSIDSTSRFHQLFQIQVSTTCFHSMFPFKIKAIHSITANHKRIEPSMFMFLRGIEEIEFS